MIFIHMLKDSRFLRRGERILRDELIRFNPVDPAESADESHADKLETKKFEVVRPCVVSGLGNVPEVALANILLILAERACICNTSEAPSRLHVAGVGVLQNSQRNARIGKDVLRMLRYAADVNDGTALPVGAVRRDRTERVSRHVERDR